MTEDKKKFDEWLAATMKETNILDYRQDKVAAKAYLAGLKEGRSEYQSKIMNLESLAPNHPPWTADDVDKFRERMARQARHKAYYSPWRRLKRAFLVIFIFAIIGLINL